MQFMFHRASELIWELLRRLPSLKQDTFTVDGLTIPFTPTMRKNSSLDKFWKAFRERYTDTDLAAGAVIALPEETFIAWLSYIHSSLLSAAMEYLLGYF